MLQPCRDGAGHIGGQEGDMDLGTGIFYKAVWRGFRAAPEDYRAHFIGAALSLMFRGAGRPEQMSQALLTITGSNDTWEASEKCIALGGEPLKSSGLKSLFDQQNRSLRPKDFGYWLGVQAAGMKPEMVAATLALAAEQEMTGRSTSPGPLFVDETWLEQNRRQVEAWAGMWNPAGSGAKTPAPAASPSLQGRATAEPSIAVSGYGVEPPANEENLGHRPEEKAREGLPPPKGDAETEGEPTPAHAGEAAFPLRRSIVIDEDSVAVADIVLPKSHRPDHPLTPSLSRFRHICLDSKTLAVLRRIAVSVHLREPLLLQGATGTSKTSLILYLAALLEQPVLRMNLNGQTDASELVGKFLPGSGDGGPAWRWCDGAAPKAMKDGLWLILDEVNLSEPQVIERLNPVLEDDPVLVISEHEDESVRAAEDFRIFGTMNPAEYSGRSTLSPAYRNRWRMAIVESAGELSARPEEDLVLIVISDGMPSEGHNPAGELKDAIARVTGEPRLRLVGLGLGEGTEDVRRFYPESRACIPEAEFAGAMGDIIECVLMRWGSKHSGPFSVQAAPAKR